jgi:hypothetical protein
MYSVAHRRHAISRNSPQRSKNMLYRLILLLVLTSAFTVGQTTYSNIDEKTNLDNGTQGWGSCTACAGGVANATAYPMYQFQQPAVDSNGSAEFFISGPAYSDALWWYKLGPNDGASKFTFDYWLTVDQNAASYAQALEFDVFQFVNNQRFMFGTQCNYVAWVWDIWNEGNHVWVHTSVPCAGFVAGHWYHFTWSFHRGTGRGDKRIHYDSLKITEYDSDHVTLISGPTTYTLGLTAVPGPLPSGWGDNLGVQFQSDLNSLGGSYPMWVDQVTLTAR